LNQWGLGDKCAIYGAGEKLQKTLWGIRVGPRFQLGATTIVDARDEGVSYKRAIGGQRSPCV